VGYRIEHAFAGDKLEVVLSGSVAADTLAALAGEIVALTRKQPTARLLVDVRGLEDRIGPVQTLRLIEDYPQDDASRTRRVAVLERPEQVAAHYFHETAARNRGRLLRHFTDAAEAARWLDEPGG
jgi:hypothetical protein